MKALKSWKASVLCQSFLWLLLFAPQAWFSLRDKNFYAVTLYCIALVAGAFLTAVFPRDGNREKSNKAKGQDEHQEKSP